LLELEHTRMWDTTAAALLADRALFGTGEFLSGVEALDAAPKVLAGLGGFRSGDLVELYGRGGAGMSQLLLQLLANTAAAGSEPLLIDADSKFCAARLRTLIASRLRNRDDDGAGAGGGDDGDDGVTQIDAAMARVSVIRCPRGSDSLIAALTAAASGEMARHHVVVIDTVNAFFWEDRAAGDAGMARQRNLVAAVRALCDPRRGAVVFAAKQALFAKTNPGTGLLAHPPVGGESGRGDLVGPGWEQLVRYRFVVDKGNVVAGSGMLVTPFKITDSGVVCGPAK